MSTRKVSEIPSRRTRQITRQAIFNPSKGVNSYGAPNLIEDKEWSDLLNIQFDESGVARKRYGFGKWCDALTDSMGLGNLVTDTISHVLTIDNGVFKYSTGTSWATDTSISFQTGYDTVFTQARGKTYIWNGTNGGSYWDGSTLARPGTMPKAAFSVYYGGYHIASGVDGQSSRLYIARLTDASIFTNVAGDPGGQDDSTEVPGATVFAGTGAEFLDVQPEDGDRITGLGVFQDTLIVFKQFSIYQFTFDDTGDPVVVPITRAAGCVSHKSISSVENDLYFLSREGVRVLGNEANFFNAIRTSILSKRLQDLTDAMSEANYKKASSIYFKNEYILSIPDSTGVLTYQIVYNKQFQSWTKWSNINAQAFTKFVNTDNEMFLIFLKESGTQCYTFTPDVYSDDGAPINSYMLSKVYDFKSPDITKYFVDLGLMFRTISGEVELEIYTEGNVLLGGTVGIGGNPVTNGMGISMLGETMLGLGGGDPTTQEAFADTVRRVKLRTKSTSIRFRIANNRNNENFVLVGFIHAFYPFTHYLFDSNKNIYL